MEIAFDPAKDAINQEKHGCSLTDVDRLDWDTLRYTIDDRFDYGEVRYHGYGLIGDRLHALVFTFRGDVLRVISLRKANVREVKSYAEND